MGPEHRHSLVRLGFSLVRTMTELWKRGFPLLRHSRHVPSNPIFKSETLFVFQLYHGRLVSLWAQPWL